MASTIKDIARLAGVSPSTVSRVFGMPHMVNPETRRRVEAISANVGYVPNRAARSLITGRTGNIAVLVPDLSNPFFPSVVKGVQLQASLFDYSVYIADTGDADGEARLAHDLAEQADGLVLCSSELDETALMSLMESASVVLLNRRVGSIPSVTFDNVDAVHQAIKHLDALGHRRIAWVGGPSASWSSRARTSAVHLEAQTAGVELIDLGSFPPRFEGGVSAGDLVIAAGVTAVIAYNDLMALGIVNRLARRGVSVPSQMSVVGIDGSLMGEISSPPLTSVALPQEQAGRTAARMLLRGLSDSSAFAKDVHLVMSVQLIVRGSTDVPADVV